MMLPLLSKKTVDVKRVGPSLIVAFHRANPPLIWRFDLERNHSFTIALEGEEGDWELGVTSPKGEFYPVTRFAQREDAEEAFNRIETELGKAQASWIGMVLKVLIAMVVIAALLVLGVLFLAERDKMKTATNSASSSYSLLPSSNAPTFPPGDIKSGVPLPADEALRPPP